MARCEICRESGQDLDRDGTTRLWREGLPHRLTDGQRLSLCIGHARAWRMRERVWYPVPYGQAARDAYKVWEDAHPPIVGEPLTCS